MTLLDFLNITNFNGIYVIIWTERDDNLPLWKGNILDIPWHIAKLKLAIHDEIDLDDEYAPIQYRDDLGKEYHNVKGLVITVCD